MNHITEGSPTHPLAVVRQTVIDSKDLKPTERLVLVVIASHANREGEAFPSAATIAEYVGCSPRNVQRIIAKLIDLGRLVVRRAAGIASNIYRLATKTQDAPTKSEGSPTNELDGTTKPKTSLEGSKTLEENKGASRRRWRDYLPSGVKSKTTPAPKSGYPYPPPGQAGGDFAA